MTDWHLILGVIAGILSVLSIIPYIKDILHGTTRPNLVSYSLWSFLILIAILAQISSGASWSLFLVIGDFLCTSTIVIFCLMGYGYKKYGTLEWTCLALSVLAIVSWKVTAQPLLAIILAVTADGMAAIPSVVKAYRDPWSELPSPWLIMAFCALLGTLSSTILNPANLIFPIYLLIVNGLTGVFALTGRHLKQKPV